MNPKLEKLGLTPEIIRRYVRFAPTPTHSADLEKVEYRRAWRARNVARGLTTEGKPRRRLPNGQRKPRAYYDVPKSKR